MDESIHKSVSAGEKLKQYRMQRNLTQEAAARMIGVSRGTVSRAESGRTINRDSEKKILDYYRITEEEYRKWHSGIISMSDEQIRNKKAFYHPAFDTASPELIRCLNKAITDIVNNILETWEISAETWERGREEGVEEVPHED